MNDLTRLPKHEKKLLSDLAVHIIEHKWPVKDNDQDIFNFIFECNSFLKGFFLIGKHK
jgi:hypothetical protein